MLSDPSTSRAPAGPRRTVTAGLCLTAILIVGALLSVAVRPPSAAAATANFTCPLLAPNTWCRHGTWHNYYGVGGDYYGAGSLQVCARVVRRSNGTVYDSGCGVNSASVSFPRCNCGGLWADIRHNGGVAHNLYGWGKY